MKECPNCKEVQKTASGQSDGGRLNWLICDACGNVFVRSKDHRRPATAQDVVNVMLEKKNKEAFQAWFAPISAAIEKALGEKA